tara:strand:+ start:1135 stop:1557 length:423 start_codon:yes stop_codon:yes gene_type:complete
VGCQTTQSEVETKPEVVKEVKVLPKEKEVPTSKQEQTQNPFSNIEIPAGQVITSTKPVICGRIDVILARMEERFGEVPILVGKVGVQDAGGERQVMSTLTYNSKTGSYTFLEQMPMEKRLMCILSSGHGKLNSQSLGTAL